MERFNRMKPVGIVWVAWSIAMLLLLFFSIDRVFEFNFFSFEIFVSIVLFFIVILLLIILGWVLVLIRPVHDINNKVSAAVAKILLELDRKEVKEEKQ